MKRSFLMSTAAAALLACVGYAFAQTSGGSQAPGGSSQAPQASPSQGAPGSSDTKGGADMKKMPSGSAETKGEMKGEGKSSGAAEMKGDTKHGASESGKSDRTGTAEQQKQDRAQKSGQSTEQQKQSTEQQKQSTEQQKQSTEQQKQNTGTGGAASANLTTEQQTRIRTVIKERSDVKAVTNVNFDISIHATVPRTVHLYALPAAVVEVHPAWRGYEFILVRDEIIVVDPRTMLIVAIIPA
jgi:hypothetical protein